MGIRAGKPVQFRFAKRLDFGNRVGIHRTANILKLHRIAGAQVFQFIEMLIIVMLCIKNGCKGFRMMILLLFLDLLYF